MTTQDEFPFGQSEAEEPATRTAPLPVAPLDDRQRLACLRLIRSENVGPVGIMAQTPRGKYVASRFADPDECL